MESGMSTLQQHRSLRQTRRKSPEKPTPSTERQSIEEDGADPLTILKAFDLNYSYGPSYGISRLERWERAKRLGRDPPVAVKQLIQQHSGKAQYTESLWTNKS